MLSLPQSRRGVVVRRRRRLLERTATRALARRAVTRPGASSLSCAGRPVFEEVHLQAIHALN